MRGNHTGRVLAGFIVGLLLFVAVLSTSDRSSPWVTAAPLPMEKVATRIFSWTPSAAIPLGRKTLLLTVTDSNGATVTRTVTIDVVPRAEVPESSPVPVNIALSNDSGDDGNDSGGGGDERGGDTSSAPRIASASSRSLFARGSSAITGTYSGLVKDGTRWVGRLAHSRALLSQRVVGLQGNCTLTATVKGDKGPNPSQTVTFVTRINKKAWKVLTLPKGHNDNKYRTYTIGLLRDFKPGTTLSFQFLNDVYDKGYLKRTGQLPEDRDLNLVIEKTTLECAERQT